MADSHLNARHVVFRHNAKQVAGTNSVLLEAVPQSFKLSEQVA